MTTFNKWLADHPEVQNQIQTPYGKNARWGRLVCKWSKKKGESEITHIFAACINLQNGDIYNDDEKKIIYVKTGLLVFARPLLNIFAKTLYHAGYEISRTAAGKQNKKTCLKNCITHLADIIRTPLWSLAMTVVHLSALILTPIRPSLIYDFRKIAGKIDKDLLRGDNKSFWLYAPCFQPETNLQTLAKDFGKRMFLDTIYADKGNTLQRGISNLARANILHSQHDNKKPYISGAYHPGASV